MEWRDRRIGPRCIPVQGGGEGRDAESGELECAHSVPVVEQNGKAIMFRRSHSDLQMSIVRFRDALGECGSNEANCRGKSEGGRWRGGGQS